LGPGERKTGLEVQVRGLRREKGEEKEAEGRMQP